MMTDREAFLMVLSHGPLLPADALVVTSGDGMTRVAIAEGILRQGAADAVVVTGGLEGNEPYSLPARTLAHALIDRGLDPKRIIRDTLSQNTSEEGRYVVEIAKARGWHRVLVAASPYHAPRLFLTFLRSILDAGMSEKLHLIVVPGYSHWWGKPDGCKETRFDLMAGEFAKIAEYGEKGHVATYAEGLAYLKFWEGDV